jgi:hypothetical protein
MIPSSIIPYLVIRRMQEDWKGKSLFNSTYLDEKTRKEIDRKVRRRFCKILLGSICITTMLVGGCRYTFNKLFQCNYSHPQRIERVEMQRPLVRIGYNPRLNRTEIIEQNR